MYRSLLGMEHDYNIRIEEIEKSSQQHRVLANTIRISAAAVRVCFDFPSIQRCGTVSAAPFRNAPI